MIKYVAVLFKTEWRRAESEIVPSTFAGKKGKRISKNSRFFIDLVAIMATYSVVFSIANGISSHLAFLRDYCIKA